MANSLFLKRRYVQGFTLIELMIVVMIIGILVTIAIPNYQNYMVRARRATAQAYLMELAQRQQQFLMDARFYAADITALGVPVPEGVSNFYNVTVSATAGPPPAFVLTATPRSSTSQQIDGPLALDHTGVRSPSGKW